MGKITKSIIGLIYCYRLLISPFLIGHCCRFHPSCSSYAIEAIKTFGLFYGLFLTFKRLFRCHPWSQGGFDPIPEVKYHAKNCH